MNEGFLQYIWKYNLADKSKLKTVQGEPVRIISPGTHNTDAGPDFFNARIKIGNTTWAGNIEVHVNSSDWYKHSHAHDKTYDNIILHVVFKHDSDIKRKNGKIIPTLVLKFNKNILNNYESLLKSRLWIPCLDTLPDVDKFIIDHWLHALMIERLERKINAVSTLFENSKNSWEDTLYIWLARNFGFSLNAEPFELLAKATPLNQLLKHHDNRTHIEAILFGQAGLLSSESVTDEYYIALKKDYHFFKQKFRLTPIEKHLWKFLRLRPSNFPTLRISQFAHLIHKTQGLFSKIIEAKNLHEIESLLKINASEYWDTHYVFGKKSGKKVKAFGKEAFHIFLINTMVPFLFFYGKQKNKEAYKAKTLSLLEELEPEKNSIIRGWREAGIKAANAFDTQALLELKKEYCAKMRCLDCQIGNKVLMTN
ncbi:MAG: DUF2851 family protein [Bacteroidia bacterium]|nr:DUF2851 family protein [Bacteroidia bacterium]